MEKKMTILEKYMKENNLSKKQLAQKCNISTYLLQRVLEKKCVLSNTLFKISCSTKIRVDDLLER